MPSPEHGAAEGVPGRVREALGRMRRVREGTLDLVHGLSQEEMDRRPAPGRWSAGEVLDHLVRTDEIYRGEVETLLERARAGERPVLRRSFSEVDASVLFIPRSVLPLLDLPMGLMSSFLPKALRDLVVRSRWLPAQNPTQSTPRPGRPAEELRRELRQGPEVFDSLVGAGADVDLAALRHFHPLLGWNDLPGVFSFIESHELRHQGQLRELVGGSAGREGRPGAGGASSGEESAT